MTIKVLHFLGDLIVKLVRLVAGFFSLLFKFLFSRILVKIYFGIFRFKNNILKEKSSSQLLNKNLAYFFIFFLAAFFIYNNVKTRNEVSAATVNNVSKTVMANLVKNEFSILNDEELIEEGYTPGSLKTAGQEKYDTDILVAIKKTPNLENISSTTGSQQTEYNPLVLVNEEAVAVKPLAVSDDVLADDGIIPERKEIVYYTVQAGDTVSTIARKFDITINTILWANNLSSYSLIRPGDSLTILPKSGVMHTVKSGDTISKIAKLYGVDENEITSSNNLGNTLKIGDKIMVPGGRKIVTIAKTTSAPSNTTGLSIIRDLVKTPAATAASSEGGKMLWPTEGQIITQYYSWRHTGLDIANKTGTPLYAAEDGTVEFAGWNKGYGYNILIDHGGGKKTRYAHASKLHVSAGDVVTRGDTIADMGSTGWSTGPHIHFEVIINGTKQNPLNYIK